MNPERWGRIGRFHEAAREKPIGERSEFLESACAGDEALCEIEAALAN